MSDLKQERSRGASWRSCFQASIDGEFDRLMQYIESYSEAELKAGIIRNLSSFEKKEPQKCASILAFYNRFAHLWGAYFPGQGVWDLAENRAAGLRRYTEDLKWMYEKLGDNRSKRIFTNILSYWLTNDIGKVGEMQDHVFRQYFDLDLIECRPREVFVDVGAYIGDTMVGYAKVFGKESYRRMYCYEVMKANIDYIHKNMEIFHLENVVVRNVGASDKAGILYLQEDGVSSTGQLQKDGEIEMPTVRIDEDIKEPIGFIKMDIEGGEEKALKGCEGAITRFHPRMALSVYHNHLDIWRLARIIHQADSSYRFYMRYYGGALMPTEYLLYAI